jgi:hypothetical protein
MSKEYVVRAAGAERAFQKFILGKFPLVAPDLRLHSGGGDWHMRTRQGVEGGSLQDLELLQLPDGSKFKGAPEAGLVSSAGPANYFLLVKQRGVDEFLALPVDQWATFKTEVKRGPQRWGFSTTTSLS